MKKLHRVSSADAKAARHTLTMAFFTQEPAETTQRREFAKFMPDIHPLREVDGYTFKQIATLLKECGLTLSVSSVQIYYRENLANMKEELESKLNEKILLRNEIKKEIQGLEPSLIPGRIKKFLEERGLSDF
jgi:hypothetical protein